MWIVNFFKELNLIRFIKHVYKKNKKMFDEKNIRIDWLGQLYTVINRDPEIKLGTSKDKNMLMIELLEINQVIEFLGLQLMFSFICEPHESKDENYYLVVFTPTLSANGTKNYVTKKSILLMILLLLFLIFGILLFIILI